MRSLTSTLLAAQKQASATPYVEVKASNKIAGVVRYDWSQLYGGSEDDHYHALTMPGDGSLIRARVTWPSKDHSLIVVSTYYLITYILPLIFAQLDLSLLLNETIN